MGLSTESSWRVPFFISAGNSKRSPFKGQPVVDFGPAAVIPGWQGLPHSQIVRFWRHQRVAKIVTVCHNQEHAACIKELLSSMRRSILHRCAVFYGHGPSAFGLLMCALLPAFVLRPPIIAANCAGMTCLVIVPARCRLAPCDRCYSMCWRSGAAFRLFGLHRDFSGD